MKLGLIYTSIYPQLEGMSASTRRVRDMCRGLSFSGANVTLFVPHRLKPKINTNESEVFQIEYVKGFYAIKWIDRVLFYIKVSLFANKNAFHGMIYYSPTIDALSSMVLLKKKILKIIEVSDLVSEGMAWKNTFTGFLFQLGEKFLPQFCDASISISKKISDFNKSQNKNLKDLILPVLVDTEKFTGINTGNALRQKYNISEDTLIIGYSGGTYTDYGLDILLESFAQIQNKYDVRLLIAGKIVSGDARYTDLEKIISEKNLSSKVHLLGWVNDDMVKKLLNESDILVIPHLDVPLNNAGLPTKLAEYAIVGKPILCTDLGDIHKYFTHKKSIFLIKGSSISDMTSGLTELINNKQLRVDLAMNAQKVAIENFDFKQSGRKLMQFIKELPS